MYKFTKIIAYRFKTERNFEYRINALYNTDNKLAMMARYQKVSFQLKETDNIKMKRKWIENPN